MSRDTAEDIMKQGYSIYHPKIEEDVRLFYSKEYFELDCTNYHSSHAKSFFDLYDKDWRIAQRHTHLDDLHT